MKLECLKSVNEMSGCTQALVRPDIFVHVVLCNCFFFFLHALSFIFVLCLYLQVRRSVESNNSSDSAFESTTGNASGVDDNTEHSTGKINFYGCC